MFISPLITNKMIRSDKRVTVGCISITMLSTDSIRFRFFFNRNPSQVPVFYLLKFTIPNYGMDNEEIGLN